MFSYQAFNFYKDYKVADQFLLIQICTRLLPTPILCQLQSNAKKLMKMFLPDEIVIDRFVPPENEGAKSTGNQA